MTETKQMIKKKIATFLLITIGIYAIPNYFVISAGNIRLGGGIWALFAMWSPGIAALVTKLIYDRNIRGLGWKWGKTKYQVWSYLLPFLYTFIAYIIIWITNLGGFYDAEHINKISTQYLVPMGITTQSHFLIITLLVLVSSILIFLIGCFFALGEEIGWSGFLVPQLSKITTFSKTALLRGVIWSVWHYPIILFADYATKGIPKWYSIICFTVFFISISYAFTWLRIKSGSLWTGVIMHASHNVFIQDIFTPLTADTGNTKYFIDEFGAPLAIVSVFLIIIFRRKQSRLDNTRTVISQ